jgi:hypothetical protein
LILGNRGVEVVLLGKIVAEGVVAEVIEEAGRVVWQLLKHRRLVSVCFASLCSDGAMLRNMCGLMSGYSKKRELRKKRSVASVDQKVRLRKGGAMAVLGGRAEEFVPSWRWSCGIRRVQSPILESGVRYWSPI